MDTEDLMTKDWVSFRGKPVRIEEISRPKQRVSVATNRMVASPKVSEIEPIPLTPEILEKNGFVEHKLQRMSIWQGDNFPLECHFTSWEYYWANGDVVINYVHELQRALKLCGITKEITI